MLSLCIYNYLPVEYQFFLYQDLLKHKHHTRAKTRNPLVAIAIVLLTVHYLLPTCVKEVQVYHFTLCPIPEVSPALLSPASLIYHQWISCNPLKSSLLIVMYKIRCKTTIFLESFVYLFRFCFLTQLSSVWLK